MKKYIKNSLIIFGFSLALISCSNYLDIQPEDKYIEEIVFSTESSVQNVINGIYIDMADNNTYGGNLTLSTIEVLAQRYNAFGSDHAYHDLANYRYTQSGVQTTFDAIWTNMYIRILNINKAIENLEVNIANIPLERLNILKGELIGLRAMLHFDLLRLYGPIYSVDSGAESIPYHSDSNTDIKPLLPASEIISKINQDLEMSVTLLNNDPVKTFGKIDVSQQDDNSTGFEGTPFYRFRNLRFNYFAAKAIQARVFLYAGMKNEASIAAKEVINGATQWFNWVNINDVISPSGSPDRIFSSEVIFGLQNTSLYDRYDELFSPNLNDGAILAPVSTRLDETFDNNLNDIRYSPSWRVPTNASKTYKVFYKFSDVSSASSFRYTQPLIRMSEMHYIAAETETDLNIATNYLNNVRQNRGLSDLDPLMIDLPLEILKEYKREFYGEGQLFFFYKRNNLSQIEDGSDSSGDITMDAIKYVIPLPNSELDFRD